MKYDWKEISSQIDQGVGGEANIKKVYHCATRFRVVVEDVNLVNKEQLEKIQLAKGVNIANGEVQIIFGAGLVNKVFEQYQKVHNVSLAQETKTKTFKWDKGVSFKDNLFLNTRSAVRAFAEIFIPLIPIFIAGGISLALNSFLGALGSNN
ncbi:hypothetical protein C4M98_04620, partial [Mycoplasmopsis pullorum]